MAPVEGAELNIEVAYSPQAGEVHQVSLKLPAGATLRQAVQASQLLTRCPELDPATGRFGVWGKARPLDWLLRDQDRVEIYRPLRVDPKEARRQRQRASRVK